MKWFYFLSQSLPFKPQWRRTTKSGFGSSNSCPPKGAFILEKDKLTFKGTVKKLFVTTSSGFSAEVVRHLKISFYFLPNTSKGTSKLGLNLTP